MGYVRCYQPGDEIQLAPRLRQADLREIEAASDLDPVDALQVGAALSVPSCTIIGNDGQVAGMFGVVPEDHFGRVWLLGSDALVTKPLSRQFLKECKQYLSGLEKLYPALGNVIDARNTVHIKWLRWLGFTFIRQVEIQGRPFWEFIKLCAWEQDSEPQPEAATPTVEWDRKKATTLLKQPAQPVEQ